jgi:hypothetical protein
MKIAKSLRLALLSTLVAVPASPLIAAKSKAPQIPVSVPAPAAGKSQVVFFRPSGKGFAIRCTVREGGKMIGRVANGKYFIVAVEPGAHKYTTKTEATDELNIEAEPDETSYVMCKIAAGIMAGRPNLSPATKIEFDAKSAKLQPQDAAKMAEDIATDQAELAKAPAKK